PIQRDVPREEEGEVSREGIELDVVRSRLHAALQLGLERFDRTESRDEIPPLLLCQHATELEEAPRRERTRIEGVDGLVAEQGRIHLDLLLRFRVVADDRAQIVESSERAIEL